MRAILGACVAGGLAIANPATAFSKDLHIIYTPSNTEELPPCHSRQEAQKRAVGFLAGGQHYGSGTLISSNYVLTARHVALVSPMVRLPDGSATLSRVVAELGETEAHKEELDVALVRLDRPHHITPVKFAAEVKSGEPLYSYSLKQKGKLLASTALSVDFARHSISALQAWLGLQKGDSGSGEYTCNEDKLVTIFSQIDSSLGDRFFQYKQGPVWLVDRNQGHNIVTLKAFLANSEAAAELGLTPTDKPNAVLPIDTKVVSR